ncbi:MAG: DUF555 domain-containing protein [Archaeoglobaceae archaeon]
MQKTHSTGRSKVSSLQKYIAYVQIPWRVTSVETVESACNISVAELSKKLPSYVDIDVPLIRCPSCKRTYKAAFLSGDEALVTVIASMKLAADSPEGAKRVAASIIKKSLKKVKFRVIAVEEIK